jgi:hypothetical protein
MQKKLQIAVTSIIKKIYPFKLGKNNKKISRITAYIYAQIIKLAKMAIPICLSILVNLDKTNP